MPVPAIDTKIAFKDLIKGAWNDANIVAAVTPDFHTGWWNPKSLGPQVTFNTKSEQFEGEAGYNAIRGDGSGPVQIANGTQFVNCWAYRDEGAGGPSPKRLVYDMGVEINRIVLANFQALADLDFISVLGITDVPPDRNADPIVFRTAVQLGFKWRTT